MHVSGIHGSIGEQAEVTHNPNPDILQVNTVCECEDENTINRSKVSSFSCPDLNWFTAGFNSHQWRVHF